MLRTEARVTADPKPRKDGSRERCEHADVEYRASSVVNMRTRRELRRCLRVAEVVQPPVSSTRSDEVPGDGK